MITREAVNSYKLEILQGIHRAADVYMIALYTSRAMLSKATTVYGPANEVVGVGYVAGGRPLSGFQAALENDTAFLDWDDPTWSDATIAAAGALIYNASRENRAVAVLDFLSSVVSTNGPFTVTLPPPTPASALVRIT